MQDLPLDFVEKETVSKMPVAYKVIFIICVIKISLSLFALGLSFAMSRLDISFLLKSYVTSITLVVKILLPIIAFILFAKRKKGGWILVSFSNLYEISIGVIYIIQSTIVKSVYSDNWILVVTNVVFISIAAVVIYLNFRKGVTELFEISNPDKWAVILISFIIAGGYQFFLYQMIGLL